MAVDRPRSARRSGPRLRLPWPGAQVDPAVALAEYLTGVELDTDPARRAAQQAFLEELLAVTPVADYTPEVAVHHARATGPRPPYRAAPRRPTT
jgi:hypothetical protein